MLISPGYGQNVREWNTVSKTDYKHELEKIENLSLGSELFESTAKFDSKGSELMNDVETNEFFSKLLAEPVAKPNVHFASNERIIQRQPSPLPRVRCDSAGNTTLKELVQTTTAQNASIHHGLYGKHILSARMFTKEQLNDIFDLAQIFKSRVAKDRNTSDILNGKIMASIFYEVSTRTQCSFAAAMHRLGGQVIYMNESCSSVKKGETLSDSIKVMAGYSDVIVLRHPDRGAVMVSVNDMPLFALYKQFDIFFVVVFVGSKPT